MSEKLLGQPVSEKIQAQILSELQTWKTRGWKAPHLVVVLVGDDPASQVYVGHKEKMCQKLGFQSTVIRMPATVSEADVIQKIQTLNADKEVDAILVQLPLPQHMDSRKVLNIISSAKDADCLTEQNIGKILTRTAVVFPCTPAGVIEICRHYNISLSGKNVAVVGRSLIVGTPLFHLLNQADATVTVFHSRSQNIKEQLKNFDIVCVAMGKPQFFQATDFKKSAIVIDVGIHRLETGLCGDVQINSDNHLTAYTPVPGGVGVMTIAILMQNTLALAKARRG